MSEKSSFDPDMAAIARRASALGMNSDGHLADVFGMDMLEAATSPTGYTAAEAYYALDQATEPSDYMGARNVGTMNLKEAAEVFGAYVEGYKEAIELSDRDAFAGLFSKARVRRYKKQLAGYKSARSADNQKKAARALGRMKALWGRMSESDRKGLISPDKASVPGVEVAKAASPKAAKIDKKISENDDASTDAADAESSAEEAMGEAFGVDGVKAYKNRKAYIELILKGRADGSLSLSTIEPLFSVIKVRRGLPTPDQVMEGAPVTVDMIVPPARDSNSVMGAEDLDLFGAEDLDIFAESNAESVMGAVFGIDGLKDYRNRKAYVEAAFNAVASGNLGKVNLVRLWTAVEGRKGLPSPSEIKAGAPITLDMAIPLSSSMAASMGSDESQDYLNRKAYVETAVRAVAQGKLGKVNLVDLWKLVKGRKGLPSPSEIKAGAPITLSMASPPAEMGYDFGDDGLPEDDSDIDAVLGADDDDDMDDLGGDEFGLLTLAVARRVGLGNPKAYDKYRRQFNDKISKKKIRGASLDWNQLKSSWAKLKPDEKKRSNLSSPNGILADIAKSHVTKFKAAVEATGVDSAALKKLIEKRKAQLLRQATGSPEAHNMGYAFGDDGLPEDDSDIDAVLGADDDDDMDDLGADDDDDMDDFGADDDDDMDDLGADDDDDMDELGADDDDLDLDELGADDDDIMGVWVISSPGSYRRQVKDLFQALKRNKSHKVKKNWNEIKHIWSKLKPNERRMVKKPDSILREAGKENMQMMILVAGKTKEQIQRLGKKKPGEVESPEAEAMGYEIMEIMAGDEDFDLDELGADEDDLNDELDALGADDDLDDDLDDMLGGEDDEDLDDDDFGEDLEQSLDLEMQRALVNRYSGSNQAFPAGNAAPFPPPRMAGQEVF